MSEPSGLKGAPPGREATLIDGEELALLRQSLRKTMESHNGAALDTALEELGWPEALAADARAAVSVLFELQGAANVTSSALDRVLAHALGYGGAAVVLPAPGGWAAPAVLEGGRLRVRGVATASLGLRETTLIVARAGASHVAAEVETATVTRRAAGRSSGRPTGGRLSRSASSRSATSWSARPCGCWSWRASMHSRGSSSAARSPCSRRSATGSPRRSSPSSPPPPCSTPRGWTTSRRPRGWRRRPPAGPRG